jgi:hypothetical protein
VIIVVVIGVAACLSARAVLRRKLDGDELDGWEWCRKQLGHREAMRVVRTTTRRRVLDRPDLKEAQLARVRYCVHVYGRARLHRLPRLRSEGADGAADRGHRRGAATVHPDVWGQFDSDHARLGAPADGDWAGAAIEAVREITGSIETKRPLRELGVTKELLSRIAADAVAVTKNAPRLPVQQQVLELLESVY